MEYRCCGFRSPDRSQAFPEVSFQGGGSLPNGRPYRPIRRHVRAQAQLSQDLLRLGREEEGWQLAQKVNQQDPYNIVAHNLVTLQGKLAKFTSLEENGILLRMDAREAQIYGPRAMRLLQRARKTLCTKYAMTIQEPVIVEIFPAPKRLCHPNLWHAWRGWIPGSLFWESHYGQQPSLPGRPPLQLGSRAMA